MSEVKKFQTETARLLDLMINSIYTNQEIFMRELISNASDAIDKYHYLSLTSDNLPRRNDYEIHIVPNKEQRTLTISDNGIGMTYDELNENLGVIAKSGSLEFLKKIEEEKAQGKENIEIIGQFGVGFYSSFMVSKKVVVETKSPFSEKGYEFSSTGQETYEIREIDKAATGTSITLYLKDNTEDNNYDKYLEEYMIRSLVKKYSDYIRYPITMYVTREEPKRDEHGQIIEGEYETIRTLETLNSMVPIWKRNKNDVDEEELNNFYMQKFYDYQPPMFHLMFTIEGDINYNALLFIPKVVPYDLNTINYERGLQLYTKGVFIMDKCKDLIPDYLRFVKGLVDSSDLSLNISREMLQQNKVLGKMAKNIEKKILSKLETLMKDDYDTYLEFFKNYGTHLKYGAYENFGARQEQLQDLLVFPSVNSEKPISFDTYIKNMKEGQKSIYYVSASTIDEVQTMPQMDVYKKHGYDVLVLNDEVDEFVLKQFRKYKDFEFKSINQVSTDELLEKEELDKLETIKEEKKDILQAMKEALDGLVKDVVISKRLTDSPVCLVSGDGISFEMEKVLGKLQKDSEIKADRILEINPNHELFKAIEKVYESNKEEIKDYAMLLYNQSLLMEGFKIENPVAFSNLMVKMMVKSVK